MSARIIWTSDDDEATTYVIGIEWDGEGGISIDTSDDECQVADRAFAEFLGLKRATFADIARIVGVTPIVAGYASRAVSSKGGRFFVYDPDKWERVPGEGGSSAPGESEVDEGEKRRDRIRDLIGATALSSADIASALDVTTRTVRRDLDELKAREVREGKSVRYTLAAETPAPPAASDGEAEAD